MVRKYAVRRLTDRKLLEQLMQNENSSVQDAAEVRLSDLNMK